MFLAGKLQIDFCWSDLVECFDLLGWSETSNQCFWLGIFYSSWYVETVGCFFQVWISPTSLVRLLWVWINILVPDGTGKPNDQNVKSLRIIICDCPWVADISLKGCCVTFPLASGLYSVLFRYVQVFCVFSGTHTVKEIMLATDRGFSQGLTLFGWWHAKDKKQAEKAAKKEAKEAAKQEKTAAKDAKKEKKKKAHRWVNQLSTKFRISSRFSSDHHGLHWLWNRSASLEFWVVCSHRSNGMKSRSGERQGISTHVSQLQKDWGILIGTRVKSSSDCMSWGVIQIPCPVWPV